jgi:hypothetical protein
VTSIIDPAVLRELILVVERTRGRDHPVAELLRRAALTNALKDHVQAWLALDALTTGVDDHPRPPADDARAPAPTQRAGTARAGKPRSLR